MSTETNKNIVRGWWDALNQGKALDLIEETYTADYVLHDPSVAEPVQGTQGVRDFIASVLSGFPDARYTIEHLVAEGDTVAQHVSVHGTHQGEFNGIPATGKPVAVELMVISRFADGRIAEEWQLFDALGMLTQMGLVPSPEPVGG